MAEFDPQAMDDAASDAENDLNTNYPDEVVLPMARWMQRWYLVAGYKRLGRILVAIAKDIKETNKKTDKGE